MATVEHKKENDIFACLPLLVSLLLPAPAAAATATAGAVVLALVGILVMVMLIASCTHLRKHRYTVNRIPCKR